MLFFVNVGAKAQMYFVSGDTLWVQNNEGEKPHFIADGTVNPIYGVAADTSAGYVYWTQKKTFGAGIFKADLDSLSTEEIYSEAESARGIALDTQAGFMYWAENVNAGKIMKAKLDGSEAEVLIDGEGSDHTNGILDVALDTENAHIYWVRTGAIMRSNLDGTEIEAVAEITSYIQPGSIALDKVNEFAYYTDTSNDEIRRVAFSGGEAETVTDAESPVAVHLIEEMGMVFWVEDYLYSGDGGAIYSAQLDGSEKMMVKDLSWTRGALFVTNWNVATSSEAKQAELPDKVYLTNNYPNPFNPQTKIKYDIPEITEVSLTVYNTVGQKVRSLVAGEVQASGSYEVTFDASDLPTGMYLYRLTTEFGTQVKKMTLIK
ncbi:T9SS type A sorting domain-containing protein [Gracilimonas tropica]|uniref:T9SS type A sorting domain-containing protein n=1 Tax=Gracilimonas tropica TaxID=454600 RepID=UPI000375535C|nr:T9SS type A sorting domain-containing protein [Gracilimonas tropica]